MEKSHEKMEILKDAFRPKFTVSPYAIYVFDGDGNVAMNVLLPCKTNNGGKLDDTDLNARFLKYVISILNNEEPEPDVIASDTMKHIEWYSDGGFIFTHSKATGVDIKVFLIRGWGHLTGIGGLHLPQEEAARLQDEFEQYIVETLNKASNVTNG